jgi:single stranded DNA-binding protein (ssb)
MKGLNKALIMGNATADPTYQTTQGGHAVASLSIATNESFTDANGQKQERAEFHRVVFWDKLADIVRQYIHKGSPLYIEGKIRTRKYNDNGIDKYITEIVANELVMLGGGNNSGNDNAGNPAQSSGQYGGNNYGGNNGNNGNNSGGNGRYNNNPNYSNGQYNGGNNYGNNSGNNYGR